jgi:phosphoglycolate phosphatase
MTTYPTVLFDLDGTIVDGRRGILQSLRHALARWNIEREDERLLAFIGPPLHEVFAEGFGFDAERTQQAVDAYREYYTDRGLYEVETYAGVPELLRELVERGATLAVATSKPHVYATRILEHFGLLDAFAFVSGPELDGTRRHKPEIIEHALTRIGDPDREQTAMIGDRFYDVEGARATGLRSIAVGWGFGSAHELARARPDFHAATVDELRGLLRRSR